MIPPLNKSRIKDGIIISIMVIGTIFFAVHLSQTTVDNDIQHFYPEHTDATQDLNEINETFGNP